MKSLSNGRYILDANGQPVEEADLFKWAEWLESADERHVADEQLTNGVWVSTVFLGLDHSFGAGPPLLYETMIFGGPHDQYQERYATRAEALAGHIKAVELAKAEKMSQP